MDVWITSYYSYGDDYGVDNGFLKVGGWGDSYYSLIRFNINGLPEQTSSAKIYLYAETYSDYAPIGMYLYRLTGDWNEDTGWFDQPNGTELSVLSAVPKMDSWYEIDITDLYNSWKNGTYPNFGIMLVPQSVDHTMSFFRSSDSEDPELRPQLIVSADNNPTVEPEPAESHGCLDYILLQLRRRLRRRQRISKSRRMGRQLLFPYPF